MSDDDMFLSSPTPSPGSAGYHPSLSQTTSTNYESPNLSPAMNNQTLATGVSLSAPTDYESPDPSNAMEDELISHELPGDDIERLVNASNKVIRVKVEFLDESGNNVAQTRYSDDQEIVNILGFLIRGNEQQFRNSAVLKICNSNLLKSDIQKCILKDLSGDFSKFISSELCPLKDNELFNSVNDLSEFDLNSVLARCHAESQGLIDAFSILCFGKNNFEEIINLPESKYVKQRLLAIMSISAISRNGRVNLYQRLIGEYLKLKNTSKQGLQLIQRLGLSLISVTIRNDQDRIAQHFLKEIHQRKNDVELWARRREMLEELMKEDEKKEDSASLSVSFTPDEFVPKIDDLGEIMPSNLHKSKVEVEPDNYVLDIVEKLGTVKTALEYHLNTRPALVDVTFDNVDIGRGSHEFIVGESKDQSLHWTSSIMVQDVVHGREIQDTKVDRSNSVSLEDKLHITENEEEHLCRDYTFLVMNMIAGNWPELLPDIQKVHIPHQYSKEFEQNITMWTGPLIFESENNLDGMKKVITHLVDVVCPAIENKQGRKVPVYPTTFSGDNKSEQSARSAQLAMADNGDMRDQLAFIEGRHEMLHFCFMFVEVIFDIFADKNNLEEASSLSRLVQWLNPKLVNKHAKDDYYKFRDMITDIYIALLGENLRHFFNVDNLEKDITPEPIKNEIDQIKKHSMLFDLIRSFVIKTHDDFKNCKSSYEEVKPLPDFYPHHEYVRKSFNHEATNSRNKETNPESTKQTATKQTATKQKATKQKARPDYKNEYAGAMLSLLAQFELLIDSIKEGNALNIFLIQKKIHKLVFSTKHKNYACSLSSFKHIVLSHPIPQFSHRYLWNQFCGREGKGTKMARDQREEHLNRFLKDGFKTLGVNLNQKNAERINNSADLGQTLVKKITDFHMLDVAGKGHKRKDRKPIIKKISEIFRQEEVVKLIPGRIFKGPHPTRNVLMGFDEAKYREAVKNKSKIIGRNSEYHSGIVLQFN